MPVKWEEFQTPVGSIKFLVHRNVDLGNSRPIVIKPWTGKNKGPRGKRKQK